MSSLFDNKSFLNTLTSIYFNKFAQDVGQLQIMETALKLVNKLYNDNYTISSASNTDLITKDIENPEALLSWLFSNEVKSNGAIIVSDSIELDGDQSKYVGPINIAGNQLYVYKDGLITFLKQIRLNAAKADTITKEKVSHLIEQFNSDKRFEIGQLHSEEPVEAVDTKKEKSNSDQPAQNKQQQQDQQQSSPSRVAPVKFNFTTPFDVATNDVISINRISRFLSEVIEISKNVEQAAAELGQEQASVANTAGQLMLALNNWLASAPNAVKIQNGFIIPGGLNFSIDTFIMTYADNNPVVGLSMISKLLPIFNQLWSIIKMIKISPTLLEAYGKDTLEKQERIVSSYVQQFNTIIQQLRAANHV